jgi:hypothetical protein
MKPAERMRGVVHALGHNLASGVRLALFMRVDSQSFRVSATQLVLLVLVSAAIDIDADWLRATGDARFSLAGLQGELFALGLLALTAAVLAAARRERSLYLALPVVILASFPIVQVVHLLPDLPRAAARVSDLGRQVFDRALFTWMFIVAARAVYVAADPARHFRRVFAALGGLLVIAPIWLAPLAGPLEPWWREYDASASAGAMNPASEPVLAAQDFLMDRALDNLDDERRGITDLYFVGFAPDGRHPGFVSDVEAAQRAMNEYWNTAGRSVVLVNSPLTVAERPFATITNLRAALLEIGDLIDADDDIVMIYLAGSPGPGRTLAAVNPPLELVDMSPAGQRQQLDAAGIRFRVIVVSTCEAGAWIDELADQETAVIASSPAGVRGEDCRGGLVASRFGDAFFGAMAKTSDLASAFDAAKKRLAAIGAPAPVMSLGPGLAEHIKSLREHRGPITTAAKRSFPAAPFLFPRRGSAATIASAAVSR